MNQDIRMKIKKEAEAFIHPATLQIWELEDDLYCLGFKEAYASGFWARYDRAGLLKQKWQKLTTRTLVALIHKEALSRHFLQPNHFTFEVCSFNGKPALRCWGVGKDGRLYQSVWRYSGVCLLEWFAYFETTDTAERLTENWQHYLKSCLKNGRWSG